VDFAVVGLDCLLPGTTGAAAWLDRSRRGEPALGHAPAGRWPMRPEAVLDPMPGAADAVTTTVGGFVDDVAVDPAGLDLAGVDLAALDPGHRQVLHVARGALGDLPRERADLVLANLALPSTGAIRAAATPWRRWLHAHGVDDDWLQSAGSAMQDADGPARLVHRALGLGGRAAALDAACASGLYAVQVACDRLATGRCDVALAAGLQRADSAYLFLGFSQLRALSPRGTPRPLDRRADGLVIGEGAAAVALKRLGDALRDGDRIHAVIRGSGLGNDGRKGNLLAPDGSGQERTLRAAYAAAGIDPASLGYVECHATGTPLGDGVEVAALARVHAGRTTPLVLCSAKGLVGHPITVAGLAGLIRAVGAVRDAVRWPLPGCEPLEALRDTPLAVLSEATPWEATVRRAAVSAFGFGGTNAHVIVEAAEAPMPVPPLADLRPAPEPLAVIGVAARIGEARGADLVAEALLDGHSLLRPAPIEASRRLATLPRGAWVDAVHVDPTRFRIPPRELLEVLPQQLVLLECAADALAQVPGLDPHRTGAVVGMGFDLHVAEAAIRQLPGDEALRDAIAPPLDAGRVQGTLSNFVANRVAAVLDLQAPSYTVSAGAESGLVALEHAAQLLARGEADAVVAGASSFRYLGAAGSTPIGEGAVALVVRRLADAERDSQPVLAVLDPTATPTEPTRHHATVGDCGPADALVAVLAGVLRQARERGHELPAASTLPARTVRVPHSGAPVNGALPAFSADWGRARVPAPLPRHGDERGDQLVWSGPATPARVPLAWGRWIGLPAEAPRPSPRPAPAPAPPPPRAVAPRAAPTRVATLRSPTTALHAEIARTVELTRATARSASAVAEAHAAWLAAEQQVTAELTAISATLDRAAAALPTRARPGAPGPSSPAPRRPRTQPPRPTRKPRAAPPPAPPLAARPVPRTSTPPTPRPPAVPATGEPSPGAPPTAPVDPPRQLDRAALERFAAGPIAEVLGPTYADLDAFEPRVRLPMGPLLLVSRVLDVQGERGRLGRSRIVTEYDLDPEADWAWEGKPPVCVVVESGQADLLLCAYLGTDAITRGEKLYRLLDCDLTFHGDRPACGGTLRHDIRIHRFARLGDTLLFYFEYDCVAASDGRPVLTMRNGCAGFFSPEELAHPRGLDTTPADLPAHASLPPVIEGAPERLDDAALRAIGEGRFSAAFGSAFAPADGGSLRLPPSRWGLLSRVTELSLAGAPHGLGHLVAEQDLRDDDWFNPIHFKGDPCMPGTLMLEGCVQALQVWLLATGVGAEFPEGRFEPVPGRTARLRCRGQVAPGHRKLVYELRVKEAVLGAEPRAVADVLLVADGVPVVLAEDVSVRIAGERIPLSSPGERVPEAALLEFAIGLPSRAFGPTFAAFDEGRRTPRIPGPPLLMMHEVLAVEGERGELSEGRSTTVAWRPDPDTWAFATDSSGDLPLGALLEVALQPCGWMTAWQGGALAAGGDVYFRNLGGTLTRHAPVGRDTEPLVTRATLTGISRSAGMLLAFFEFTVRVGDRVVAEGDTHFGYFTPAALAAQKGLGLPIEDEKRRKAWRRDATTQTFDVHPALPREGWRRLDRVTVVAPTAGSRHLGYWEAEAVVDERAWFFTAHFRQDPVMPGSLGLDALAQLAAVALYETIGGHGPGIQLLDQPAAWKYRGQVLRNTGRLTFGLDVTEIDLERGILRGDGVVWADRVPIYAFEGLGVQIAPEPAPEPASDPRRAVAALLDGFTARGDQGTGFLRLDPARHPWLADHCPTLVIPAVPLAFAAEIAAEAALRLRPGKKVIGLPQVTAEQWLHTAEGPVELLVAAVAEGDTVAVTLAVHHDNPRFPKLSGPRVHMRAIVQVGDAWLPADPEPEPLAGAQPVELSADAYYAGGLTFHGPVLQGMVDLGVRGSRGAEATFRTRPDADLLPPGSPDFVLDPRLLDTATHPMMSGSPEVWVEGLAHGSLAYPVACDHLRLHGPRPSGEVRCRLDLIDASPEHLVFDVRLSSDDGPWASFRWTESLVQGGPLLGANPTRIARFCKAREAAPVHVGRAVDDGWQVRPDDLVEPIPGTLIRLLCTPAEAAEAPTDEDAVPWQTARFAAKEALRAWLVEPLGRDVHPAALRLARLRPGRFVVTDATSLTLQEQTDHLHPTRVVVDVRLGDDGTAVARVREP